MHIILMARFSTIVASSQGRRISAFLFAGKAHGCGDRVVSRVKILGDGCILEDDKAR